MQRLKLRHATLLYHDYPLPALLCDLGEDWRAQELGRPWQVLGEQDEKGVLRYRLQRIEAITGLKINQLTDSLRLYIGMLRHD